MKTTKHIDKERFGQALAAFMQRTKMNGAEVGRITGTSGYLITSLRRGNYGYNLTLGSAKKIAKLIGVDAEKYLIEQPDEQEPVQLFWAPAEPETKQVAAIDYDQLYKTIYGALYAVMEQFWG